MTTLKAHWATSRHDAGPERAWAFEILWSGPALDGVSIEFLRRRGARNCRREWCRQDHADAAPCRGTAAERGIYRDRRGRGRSEGSGRCQEQWHRHRSSAIPAREHDDGRREYVSWRAASACLARTALARRLSSDDGAVARAPSRFRTRSSRPRSCRRSHRRGTATGRDFAGDERPCPHPHSGRADGLARRCGDARIVQACDEDARAWRRHHPDRA